MRGKGRRRNGHDGHVRGFVLVLLSVHGPEERVRLRSPRERADAWFPIDLYIGGIEHATGHLIYCRFFTKFMRDIGLLAHDEPVTNLLTQGMVISYSSFCEEHRWLYPDQVREDRVGAGGAQAADPGTTYHCLQCGRPVTRTLEKMSKSKNNIVDPDAALERYGADAIRIFAPFASPPDAEVLWTEQGMEGRTGSSRGCGASSKSIGTSSRSRRERPHRARGAPRPRERRWRCGGARTGRSSA